jgi:hypothetical protein
MEVWQVQTADDMTAQMQDRLLYRGDCFGLCTEPLEMYFSLAGNRPDFPPRHTACWRGYIATWEIRDNKLYLLSMDTGPDRSRAEDPETWELMACCGTIIAPETIFPGEPLPVLAVWFSGQLRCVKGDMVNYIHMGCASTFEHEFLIELENGVVVGEPVCSDDGLRERL